MIKGVALLLGLFLLMSCSPRPAYEDVISTFQNNRPTFTMIASLACDIGERAVTPEYQITGNSKHEKELLALAQSVNIDAITVTHDSGRCYLSMPLWEATDDSVSTRYAYRYNVRTPSPYLQNQHSYQQVAKSVSQKSPSRMAFDMKLSSKWFFSFKARYIGS